MRIHIQGDLYLRYGYDKCTVFQLLELMIFTYVHSIMMSHNFGLH